MWAWSTIPDNAGHIGHARTQGVKKRIVNGLGPHTDQNELVPDGIRRDPA
jgi:hypothetical protein